MSFFDSDPNELDKAYRMTQVLQHPELARFSNEQYRTRIADELNDLFDEEVVFTGDLVSRLCRSNSIQEAAGELSSERWWDLDLLVTALGYGFGVPAMTDAVPDFVSTPVTRQPNRDLLRRALKEIGFGQ